MLEIIRKIPSFNFTGASAPGSLLAATAASGTVPSTRRHLPPPKPVGTCLPAPYPTISSLSILVTILTQKSGRPRPPPGRPPRRPNSSSFDFHSFNVPSTFARGRARSRPRLGHAFPAPIPTLLLRPAGSMWARVGAPASLRPAEPSFNSAGPLDADARSRPRSVPAFSAAASSLRRWFPDPTPGGVGAPAGRSDGPRGPSTKRSSVRLRPAHHRD